MQNGICPKCSSEASFPRSSGVLLHPTSLPGPFGIGDLGPAAYAFADFLTSSRQSLWQVLPLGPTGYGASPYACYSAFAGNTLLISPEALTQQGLLLPSDLPPSGAGEAASERIDFAKVTALKDALLRKAFERNRNNADTDLCREFESFVSQQAGWLEDYALFRALKDDHRGIAWYEWEPALARRSPAALNSARERLAEEVEAQKFYQFLFFRQWFSLKQYCNDRGIQLVGDLAIFVAHDSSDVWTNPKNFKLHEDGNPIVVAGVPPDYFSTTGQLWGNPIYDWDWMRADGFKWWIERVRATLDVVDIVRVDHFRGFAACWEIPGGATTAEKGQWVGAPGKQLFRAIEKTLGQLPIIAEDLGVITPDVVALRDAFGFPGMRILQFGFGSDADNSDLPHNYVSNTVAYTGTHDNDTTVGWFSSIASDGSTRTQEQIDRERSFCLNYLNAEGREIHWELMRAVWASVANTAIVPLQDVMGLGSEARTNLPNTTTGNWAWRYKAEALTEEIEKRLRELTELYGRSSDTN